jgi:short-subunit dehydrogenase
MAYTLITGASAGIGYEIAKCFYSHGHSLLLVARNTERLEALKQKLPETQNQKIKIIAMDLSSPNAARLLFEQTQQHGWHVNTLINNAGFGTFGRFDETHIDTLENMMNLNMINLTALIHFFITPMCKAKHGHIINIASTAAFQGIPKFSVYAASKAFVLHLSEALHVEYKNYGICVSAICPGATTTLFAERAQMQNSKIFKPAVSATPESVAALCYNTWKSRKAIAVHGIANRLLVFLSRFIPRTLNSKLAGKFVDV